MIDINEQVEQDLRAMRSAKSWSAVESMARAMRAVGHWTPPAQLEYLRQMERWGAEPQ